MVNRREFLTSIAAAASAAGSSTTARPSGAMSSSAASSSRAVAGNPAALAINGGKPVRETPLWASECGMGTEFYDDKERGRLGDVVASRNPFRWYGPGPEPPMQCATFEKEFSERMQGRYVLGVTSGTAALQVAMAALGVGPGDEVILPAWTWYSSYNAIVLAGALPVFAESDKSLNIDPEDIEHRITPQTKAIMAVHLEGCPCDMDRILPIARKHGIKVLEDCAQSAGASYKGKPLGAIGDIAIYSFQLCKTITSGEGGCVVTGDPILFERACRFHDLGPLRPQLEKQLGGQKVSAFAGTNFRMSEFTGGVLVAQLRKLDSIVAALRANGRRVYEGLRDLPDPHFRLVSDPDGDLAERVYLEFPTKQLRDRYIEAMKAENVPAGPPNGSVILPIDPMVENKVTAHPAWPSFTTPRGRAIRYGAEACPRTIDILNRFASVGIDPKFTQHDTEDIATAINKVYPVILQA
ncbi:MAG: glutamine--scyllo-inositol aminotransferase [Acidobacteria bacterium]|nr:MAG: glutamine--scyllo-inositol aminotransferase [Acidobacteriota bacterium]